MATKMVAAWSAAGETLKYTLDSLESPCLFSVLKFSLMFLSSQLVYYHWFFQIYGANYTLNEVKFLTKVIKSNFVSYPQVDKLVGLLTLIF